VNAIALRELSPEAYAKSVLPLTAELWSDGRDFATYTAQTLEIARSPYGKKSYKTLGLFDGRQLVASMKRYERTLHAATPLKAVGIGAVFTPQEYRGRGFASHMIAGTLDAAARDGLDVAYLFSDIHPAFYAALGFTELPSRSISLRADDLVAPRVRALPVDTPDWPSLRRCFDATLDVPYVERTPTVWNWVRLRLRQWEHAEGQSVNLAVRRSRNVAAYVFGKRIPRRDAFVIYEFGCTGEETQADVLGLLRAAAGDLRRITGWLPPHGAREILPRGSVRKRDHAILMAAPLTTAGKAFIENASRKHPADLMWSTDHI